MKGNIYFSPPRGDGIAKDLPSDKYFLNINIALNVIVREMQSFVFLVFYSRCTIALYFDLPILKSNYI